ncbi:ECF transporter S component [Lactobacillus psittaci]|uniref:ABC-type cobalt transport system n=1 Tax=Lactobacillus psittaci DSM 15354 TaxID=1122152 RepID=A0A0R1S3X4_9LACO|nr:ECF transporter S component [Lactobacillus psittaci]KRL63789.1 ABC-type cobalt transport system [Lactobacillus psittaci DSM 15354]
MFKKKFTWDIQAIVLISLIGLIMGVIYTYGFNLIYNLTKAALLPTGYAQLADTLMSGLWYMAAPLAVYFVPVKGSSTLGETLAAFGEMLVGGQWGAITILSGFIQGLGNEVGFIRAKGREHFSWPAVLLGATGAHVTGFFLTYALYGWYKYNINLQILMFLSGWLSSLIFDGVLVKLICQRLERAFNRK